MEGIYEINLVRIITALIQRKIYVGERIRDIKYHKNSKSLILALTSTGSIGIIKK